MLEAPHDGMKKVVNVSHQDEGSQVLAQVLRPNHLELSRKPVPLLRHGVS